MKEGGSFLLKHLLFFLFAIHAFDSNAEKHTQIFIPYILLAFLSILDLFNP